MKSHNKTLISLFAEHRGKVSDKWSIYLAEYDRLFQAYRDRPVRLLEIGIQNGGSLEIWSKFFSKAEKLVGCDINPDCAQLQFDDPKIAVVVADANTDDTQQHLLNLSPEFDLIIDDGSHHSGDIVRSFARYFTYLNDGGLYIAEDLHCSYWQDFEGGLFQPYSSIAFFKQLADTINHEHWGVDKTRSELLHSFNRQYNTLLDEVSLAHIHSIEFINSMCVIRKAIPADNVLGRRFVAGTNALVWEGALQLHGSSCPQPNQSENQWATKDAPVDELAGQLQKIASLNQAVSERDGEIQNINQAITEREQAHNSQLAQARQQLEAQLLELAEREKTYAQQLQDIQQAHEQQKTEQSRQHAEHEQAHLAQLALARQQLETQLLELAERERTYAQQLQDIQQAHEQQKTEQDRQHAEHEQAHLAQLALVRQQLETQLLELAERERTYAQQLQDIQQAHEQQKIEQGRQHAEREQAHLAQLALARQKIETHLIELAAREKAFSEQLQEIHQRADAERTELSRQHQAHLQEIKRQQAEHEWLTAERIHMLNQELHHLQADNATREQAHADIVDSLQKELTALLRMQAQREQETAAQLLAIQQQANTEKTELSRQHQAHLQEIKRQQAEHEWLTAERIHTLNQELHRLQADNVTREQAHADIVASLQKELTAHLRMQAQREQEMTAQLLAIQQRAEQEKAEQAHALQSEHAEREQALSQQLQAGQQDLRYIEQARTDMQRQFTEREQAYLAQLTLARQQLETQLLELAEREKAFSHQLQEIQQTHEQQKTEQNRQHAEHEQALNAQLHAKQDELHNLTHRWIETEKAQAQALAQLHHELNAMRATNSWRWTAPLRSLATLLGKKDSGDSKLSPSTASVEPTNGQVTNLVVQSSETPSPLPQNSSITNNGLFDMSLSQTSSAAATLAELLSYNDERFIHSAYRTLLGRAPDYEGLRYYLARVRAGINKVEILAQLRLSAEGKSRQVKIAGLDNAISRHNRLKTPLIGALLRLAGMKQVEDVQQNLRAAVKPDNGNQLSRFDADWYLKQNPDVAASGMNPFDHYILHGKTERRCPAFDSDWYVTQYPDVAESGMDPLDHYILHGQAEGRCPAFDSDWYVTQYPDVAESGMDPLDHYITHGKNEGRYPAFDRNFYWERYPDVRAAGLDPYDHYINNGKSEGRYPANIQVSDLNNYPKIVITLFRFNKRLITTLAKLTLALLAPVRKLFIRAVPRAKLLRWYYDLMRCPLFDRQWYLAHNPDVAQANTNPLWHYLVKGWRENRRPGPEFDGEYYRARYPDIAGLDQPPLLHYWLHGRHEGRYMNPLLDLEWLQGDAHTTKLPHQMRPEGSQLAAESLTHTQDAVFISVIIPTYNRIKLLPGIIDSWRKVHACTSCNYEIIFSDDGSSDSSVEYLESVKDLPLRVLRNAHGGASSARNAAIRAACGERLIMVGDDIFPDQEFLNIHARLAQQMGPNVIILGTVDWHKDLDVNHLMQHITEIGNEQFSYNRLKDGSYIDFRHFYTCNISVDRHFLLEEKVIFDERFDTAAFEDVELGYRLCLRGMRLFYTTQARGAHYHPYTAAGFCRRQTSAGRMAVVFGNIHPAIKQLLGIGALSVRARKNRKSSGQDALWQSRVDMLIRRCDEYEHLVAALPKDVSMGIRQCLSSLYSRLFSAMYEYGVLNKLGNYPNALAIPMAHHFEDSWNNYWALLAKNIGQPIDLGAAESYNLNVALNTGNSADLFFGSEQRAVFDELLQVKSLTHIGHIDLQPTISPLQTNPTPAETALPALVIEPDTNSDEAIALFRAAFGDAALVYERVHGDLLIPQLKDSRQSEPVMPSVAEATIFFWPTSMQAMPLRDQLLSAYMALIENGLSVAVISHNLALGQTVSVGALRDHMLFSREVAEAMFNGTLSNIAFRGKILRLLPANGVIQEQKLDVLMGAPVDIDDDGFFTSRSKGAIAAIQYRAPYLPPRTKTKPVVFVFPIFLAVGGVERNTIEIMRKLRDRFDFVVVTMERLRPEQGSLAAQAHDVAASVIEMSEIVRNTDYLRVLARLKANMQPDLVWVCNGSPWFCDNAAAIRQIFHDVPIIDQEVYDTEQGWITRYGEAGIQSFDHFIAVNKKIKTRFLNDFAISPERCSLIYSAIDTPRISSFKQTQLDKVLLRAKFGLPHDKKIFTFIARLTAQKRPLLFLGLAKNRLVHSDECYVFVGDGELAPEALDFIKRHALKNVIRIPYIQNTLELNAVSDGIIFTSAYEGLPIAMLEALSMGVPAFSTDVGDIADVLNEYGGGQVIPPVCSDEQLNEAFNFWLSRRNEYAANLKVNERKILDRFSSTNIANQYAACWQQAMANYARVTI